MTVYDEASHQLARPGGVHGTPTVQLGVNRFDLSRSTRDLRELFDLLSKQIIRSALPAMATSPGLPVQDSPNGAS